MDVPGKRKIIGILQRGIFKKMFFAKTNMNGSQHSNHENYHRNNSRN